MPYIYTPKGDVYCEEYGSGENTQFLVHGLGGSMEYYKEYIKCLREMDIPAVAIDIPGFGKSSKGDYVCDTNGWAESAYEAVKSLELKNIDGVGHSMGGNAILKAEYHHPGTFDNMVFICSPLFPPKRDLKGEIIFGTYGFERGTFLYKIRRELEQYIPNFIRKKVMRDGFLESPANFNELYKIFLGSNWYAFYESLSSMEYDRKKNIYPDIIRAINARKKRVGMGFIQTGCDKLAEMSNKDYDIEKAKRDLEKLEILVRRMTRLGHTPQVENPPKTAYVTNYLLQALKTADAKA